MKNVVSKNSNSTTVKPLRNKNIKRQEFDYYITSSLDTCNFRENMIYCVQKDNGFLNLRLNDPYYMMKNFKTYIYLDGSNASFMRVKYDKKSAMWEDVASEIYSRPIKNE